MPTCGPSDRGTVLGNLWSVLNPLFQAGIYYFLYTVLRSGAGAGAFLPILIANFFFFGLSMTALGEGGSSIKRGKGLMLNSTFPRALLPMTTVYKSLRSFVPAACVLVVLFPLVGGTLGPGLFVLPLLFAHPGGDERRHRAGSCPPTSCSCPTATTSCSG